MCVCVCNRQVSLCYIDMKTICIFSDPVVYLNVLASTGDEHVV